MHASTYISTMSTFETVGLGQLMYHEIGEVITYVLLLRWKYVV
jgi:hypothetical protein